MRDAVSKVLPARQLFEDLLYPRGQILVEMQFVEVSHSRMLNYGFSLQNSVPITSLSNFGNNAPQIATNLAGMLVFGGGRSMFGLGLINPVIVASLTRSDAKVLLEASARSTDGQPATIHIGQKYPILTAGYFGPSSFSGPNAYAPPPSFTFEDLGVSLKATPHLHGREELTLALEAEFKVLTGGSANGIPIIANRSLKSEVGLKMGEWALVTGLIDVEEARTIAGMAGLGYVPLVGPFTATTTRNNQSDEVLILLRPSLVTPPPDESLVHVFRLGTETRPLTPL